MWCFSMRRRVVRADAFRYIVVSLGFTGALCGGAWQASAQCHSGTGQTYQAGMNANAAAYYSTAVGYNAQALCENSIAIGHSALAAGGPGANTAVGNSAQVHAPNGTAVGGWSTAWGNGASAFGGGAFASGDMSTAVGSGARAEYLNSTAIGQMSQSTRDYQMMFGTGLNTYTLAGLASASSSAAQTGLSRYMVTSDEHGNLALEAIPASAPVVDNGKVDAALARAEEAHAGSEEAKATADEALSKYETALEQSGHAQTMAEAARDDAHKAQQTADGALRRSGGSLTGMVDMGGYRIENIGDPVDAGDAANKGYVDARAGELEGRIGTINTRLDEHAEGLAMAMAMGGGVVLPAGKTFAIGANVGYYEEKQAFAAQALLRVGRVLTFNTAVGFGLENQSNIGARAGFMAAW